MTARQRALVFLGCLGAALAAGAALLTRGVPLQTNLLAMLPPTERDPLAEQVVASLGTAIAGRTFFVVSHPQDAVAKDTAERFAAAAARAGGFRTLVARLPQLDPGVPLALYARHRFGLLSERDRDALASGSFRLRETVLRQVNSPLAAAAGLPLARDPFGFYARWIDSLEPPAGVLRLEDGYLVSRDAGRSRVLVIGEVDGDVYDNAVQSRVLAAVERATAAVAAADATIGIQRTGAVFFAAAARAAATADMDRIGVGSLAGITLLMLGAFRSLGPVLLGLLSAGAGILGATLALVLFDGELHLITLAFGASLIGEAIDYAILFCAARVAAGAAWTPEAGIAQLRPGLTVAVATSLLAYALLGLLPFPGVAQIARFALVGLTVSYLSVLWLLPGLLVRPARRDAVAATAWAAGLLEAWSGVLRGRRAAIACAVVLAACVPGWLALESNDDVRLLVPRQPALLAQDQSIRALTGFDAGGRFLLVRGADDEQVLTREAALVRRLRGLEREGALASHLAVSDFVPPRALQESDRALIEKRVFADRAALQRELLEIGFRPDAVNQLPVEFDRAHTPVTVQDWLASPLSAPLRHLWAPAGNTVPASVVTLQGERDPRRLARSVSGLDGVSLVDKAGNVAALLGWYRAWAAPGLAAAAALMLLVLVPRYGWRAAPRVMLPVALGEALSLAVFGYAGEPATLFAVAGWALTLGIGVNYSIFLREGFERPGATALAVLLSASTTLLSFGLLSFSGVAALKHFGLALLTGIAASLLFAPLAIADKKTAAA